MKMSSTLLGQWRSISVEHVGSTIGEEVYSSCFLIGRVYVILDVHKLPMELLGTILEIFLIQDNNSSFSTTSVNDIDIVLFCTGVLVPVLRSLSAPASRIFVKIVDNLVKSHPAIAVNCLIVPSVTLCVLPIIGEANGGNVIDRKDASGVLKTKTHQLEFLQRVFRQAKDMDIVNHLLVLLLDPLEQSSRNYFVGLCHPISAYIKIFTVIDAYMISNANRASTGAMEDLWTWGKSFSISFLQLENKCMF